jgi:hypothetical protein
LLADDFSKVVYRFSSGSQLSYEQVRDEVLLTNTLPQFLGGCSAQVVPHQYTSKQPRQAAYNPSQRKAYYSSTDSSSEPESSATHFDADRDASNNADQLNQIEHREHAASLMAKLNCPPEQCGGIERQYTSANRKTPSRH